MKSKFFCVAVEGATTDGRVIEGSWITEMAANYKLETYTAAINVEHIRGYSPEAPFNNYGSILALEEREIHLTIAGKTETKKALFAQVDGNDQLVALSKAKQKRFPSIEVNPNFAGKGQAYCVGLAMTDSPASLGTEMLQFAAQAKVHPFAARKQHADNLFSAADTVDGVIVEFEAEPADTNVQGFSLAAVLDAAAKKFNLKPAETPTAPATPAAAPAAADFAAGFAELSRGLKVFTDGLERDRATDRAAFGQLQSDFTTLKTQLEGQPNQNHSTRPPATGGAGGIVTDC
jgi:hypothetical protein